MRFAIIGTGWITEEFVKAVSECGDVEVAAIYSRSLDKAERFASAYSIPETFTCLQSLADSPMVDAVYIASPSSLHFEHSVLMMRGGKHVLCEKPIATSAEELSQMIRIAGQNGVVLLEAAKNLLAPGLGIIRNLIPEIGTIRRVSIGKNQYSSVYDEFKLGGEMHNVFRPEYAGGALMDVGVYCVELMVALFGEPESVVSSSTFLHTGVDGHGAVIAKYDEFLVELSYSMISQSLTPSVIQGEEGSLLFSNPSKIDKIEVVKRNGEKREVTCMDPKDHMVYEVRAFHDMTRNPQKVKQYHEYSLTAHLLMDEIKRKWRN